MKSIFLTLVVTIELLTYSAAARLSDVQVRSILTEFERGRFTSSHLQALKNHPALNAEDLMRLLRIMDLEIHRVKIEKWGEDLIDVIYKSFAADPIRLPQNDLVVGSLRNLAWNFYRQGERRSKLWDVFTDFNIWSRDDFGLLANAITIKPSKNKNDELAARQISYFVFDLSPMQKEELMDRLNRRMARFRHSNWAISMLDLELLFALGGTSRGDEAELVWKLHKTYADIQNGQTLKLNLTWSPLLHRWVLEEILAKANQASAKAWDISFWYQSRLKQRQQQLTRTASEKDLERKSMSLLLSGQIEHLMFIRKISVGQQCAELF